MLTIPYDPVIPRPDITALLRHFPPPHVSYGTYDTDPIPIDKLPITLSPTQTPLLNLPTELLMYIVEALPRDSSALAAFALANSDCRQLARSRQFATTLLCKPKVDVRFLDFLLDEAVDCQLGSSIVPINTCIKTIRFQSIQGRGGCFESRRTNYLDSDIRWKFYSILNDPARLPNISVVDFGRIDVEEATDILKSTRNARLRGIKLTLSRRGSDYDTSSTQNMDRMQLPSLQVLNISHNRFVNHTVGSSPCFHMIERVSTRLESLTINTMMVDGSFNAATLSLKFDFPVLQRADIDCPTMHEGLLSAVLQSPRLITFRLSTTDRAACRISNSHGLIPTLKHLRIEGRITRTYSPSVARLIPFIVANPQLEMFYVPTSMSSNFLSETLLPALTSCEHLVSLSLTQSEGTISATTLHYLAQLTSLERLRLRCGDRMGWHVDHKQMSTCLAPLRKLRFAMYRGDRCGGESLGAVFEQYRVQMPALESMFMGGHLVQRGEHKNVMDTAETLPSCIHDCSFAKDRPDEHVFWPVDRTFKTA